jgi:hypothetical protein
MSDPAVCVPEVRQPAKEAMTKATTARLQVSLFFPLVDIVAYPQVVAVFLVIKTLIAVLNRNK